MVTRLLALIIVYCTEIESHCLCTWGWQHNKSIILQLKKKRLRSIQDLSKVSKTLRKEGIHSLGENGDCESFATAARV